MSRSIKHHTEDAHKESCHPAPCPRTDSHGTLLASLRPEDKIYAMILGKEGTEPHSSGPGCKMGESINFTVGENSVNSYLEDTDNGAHHLEAIIILRIAGALKAGLSLKVQLIWQFSRRLFFFFFFELLFNELARQLLLSHRQ